MREPTNVAFSSLMVQSAAFTDGIMWHGRERRSDFAVTLQPLTKIKWKTKKGENFNSIKLCQEVLDKIASFTTVYYFGHTFIIIISVWFIRPITILELSNKECKDITLKVIRQGSHSILYKSRSKLPSKLCREICYHQPCLNICHHHFHIVIL